LPTDLTRSLMLFRGPSIGINRDSADAFNDLLEIQLHCLYLLLRPEPRRTHPIGLGSRTLFGKVIPTLSVRRGRNLIPALQRAYAGHEGVQVVVHF